MKETLSVNVEKEHIKALENHPLKQAVGKSGLIRIAISEFLEREKLEEKIIKKEAVR